VEMDTDSKVTELSESLTISCHFMWFAAAVAAVVSVSSASSCSQWQPNHAARSAGEICEKDVTHQKQNTTTLCRSASHTFPFTVNLCTVCTFSISKEHSALCFALSRPN